MSQRVESVESNEQKERAPKGSVCFLLTELAFLARESYGLSAGDIVQPLRSSLTENLLAGLGIDLRPIADAESDVVESLRKRSDVFCGCFVARPQVYVDDDAGIYLDSADVNENGVFLTDLYYLRSKLDVLHAAGIEVKRCYIVNIGLLGEIDVCHNTFI